MHHHHGHLASKQKNQTHHKTHETSKTPETVLLMRRTLQKEKIGYQQDDGGEGEEVDTAAGEELACKVSGMRRLKVHFIVAWESLLFRGKDSCNSDKIHTFGSNFTSFFGRSSQPT